MIRRIKKFFKGLFIALDSLELIVAFILATAIFFAIPYYLVKSFYRDGQVLLSIVISAIVISSFGVCIRDFKKKKWSVLSILITFLWGICFLIVVWIMAT